MPSGLTVRRGRRRRCERRVDLLMIVPGGDGERVAMIRRGGRGRGSRCGPVVVIVPGRGVCVQRADVMVREERVHVVCHVVGHQWLVPAGRRRTGRRFVPAPVVRVMMVMVMGSGSADHFHAGSHFHAALKTRTAVTLQHKTDYIV